jgi:hypothetical protein
VEFICFVDPFLAILHVVCFRLKSVVNNSAIETLCWNTVLVVRVSS